MFSAAVFINSTGNALCPFQCESIRSYLRGEILVITDKFFMNHQDAALASQVVIIGASPISGDCTSMLFSGGMKTVIEYLSENHSTRPWWIVGDNALINRMIQSGLTMNVYMSKSYTNQYVPITDDLDRLDLQALYDSDLEFNLMSTFRTSRAKSVRHFSRQNTEEAALIASMRELITCGYVRSNRTGIATRALFGKQFEYRMIEKVNPDTGTSSYRIPLLTTKRIFVRGVFAELKWFFSGCTNSKELEKQGVNIWKGNSSREYLDSVGLHHYDEGECGPIYGHQFRHYGAPYISSNHDYTGEGIDQVRNVIDSLKADPFGRRHVINLWNVEAIQNKELALPPCHVLYQLLAHEEEGQIYLTLIMFQRSCDVFHGLPFNIASCAMFLMIIAHQTGYKPFKVVHSIADFHIYESHIQSALKQIQRSPCAFPYAAIICDPKKDPKDYDFSDLAIEEYNHYPAIKEDMVV